MLSSSVSSTTTWDLEIYQLSEYLWRIYHEASSAENEEGSPGWWHEVFLKIIIKRIETEEEVTKVATAEVAAATATGAAELEGPSSVPIGWDSVVLIGEMAAISEMTAIAVSTSVAATTGSAKARSGGATTAVGSTVAISAIIAAGAVARGTTSSATVKER
eukprot:CAMPEP_0170500876 /NCGR_PEP_ID=MMETSP0208-20121228/36388_1 /TAXON_ID=197538 /ORGANISM="Strombidium inclinatum, Strain S3" /LENGTH=160 /DNA_ID=CAMNT_0010779123 /DNA_START=2532 /DNA_END=3014 /DNA_ORIENTATION=-